MTEVFMLMSFVSLMDFFRKQEIAKNSRKKEKTKAQLSLVSKFFE